jgi:hypothetical protein
MIGGASHILVTDRPERTAAVLRAFLDGLAR